VKCLKFFSELAIPKRKLFLSQSSQRCVPTWPKLQEKWSDNVVSVSTNKLKGQKSSSPIFSVHFCTVCVRDCDVHKQRNRTTFFFPFLLLCPNHFLKIHQKNYGLHPFAGVRLCFPVCVFHFAGVYQCFLAHVFFLHKGHNSWHTLYRRVGQQFRLEQSRLQKITIPTKK
jgi:hypothetical protein